METILSLDLIATDPDVRSGRPYIVGTTIPVADVVTVHITGQQSADELATHYDLSLSQVYAALAYYYAHKSEIDTSIAERRQLAEEMKAQRVGSRHKPLFG